MNGMHITVLTTVADDSRTRLSGGLAPQRLSPLRARTNAISVISALPFTLYPKDRFFANAGRRQGLGMLSRNKTVEACFKRTLRSD
jgi:hypothetical protein